MSGTTIISPNAIDTTVAQDGQAAGAFTLGDERQINDSLAGLFVDAVSTTTYTFVATDYGKLKESTNAGATTFTVPPNASVGFQVGTVISFRQYGAGQLTIAPGAGVTLRTASSLTTRAQYSSGALHKRATDEWVVTGDLT